MNVVLQPETYKISHKKLHHLCFCYYVTYTIQFGVKYWLSVFLYNKVIEQPWLLFYATAAGCMFKMRFDRRRSSSYRGLHLNDKILVGVEITAQFLGSGKISQAGGTDYEIARVIYDIHCLYAEEKNKLKKAREVVVFIDSQRIDISSKKEDRVLVNFPLTQVKDVSLCLNEGPYSRTCVLVARENVLSQYKAYVFYCKTDDLAHEFYELATLAFQLGYKLLEKFYRESSSNDQPLRLSRRKSAVKSSIKRLNVRKSERSLQQDEDSDGSDNVFCEEYKSDQIVDVGCVFEIEQCSAERTVTIPLKDEDTPAESKKAGSLKLGKRKATVINTELKDRRASVDGSEFELGKWFRKSCRRIRKYFRQDPTVSNDEDFEMSA